MKRSAEEELHDEKRKRDEMQGQYERELAELKAMFE